MSIQPEDKEQLQKAYDDYAGQDKLVSHENIQPILKQFQQILQLNSNQKIPKNLIQDNYTYENIIQIIQQQQIIPPFQAWFPNEGDDFEEQQNQFLSYEEIVGNYDQFEKLKNYNGFTQLFEDQAKQLEKQFKNYTSDGSSIYIEDSPPILQLLLYSNHYTLYTQDHTNFFQQAQSYKTIIDVAHEVIKNEQNQDQQDQDNQQQPQNQNNNQDQVKDIDNDKKDNQDKDQNKDQDKDLDKDLDKNKDQDQDQDQNKDKDNDKDQDQNNDKNQDQDKDQDKDKDKDKDQDQDKDKDQDKKNYQSQDQDKNIQDKSTQSPNTNIDYTKLIKIVYFLISLDEGITLQPLGYEDYQEQEKQEDINPYSDLQKQIEDQIQKYQSQLENSVYKKEKLVLESMILDLNKQLETLKNVEEEEEENVQSEVDLKKRENNLKKIYMFYCSQQPERLNTIQYKKQIKPEDLFLHFDTFIMFTKHFNIMGQEKRKPKVTEKNTLEMKRMGVIDVYDDQEDQLMLTKSKNQSQSKSIFQDQTKIGQVQSKHRWWNNQQFDKYYNPLKQMDIIDETEFMEYRKLDSKKIAQMFKRQAVGRSINYNQFKSLIMAVADNMFYDLDNPDYSHPQAYEKFLQQIIQIDNFEIIKKKMKPLHQKQEVDLESLMKQPTPVKPQIVASANFKRISANYDSIMNSKSTPQLSMAQLIQGNNREVAPNVFALSYDSKNVLPSLKQKYQNRASEIEKQQRIKEKNQYNQFENKFQNKYRNKH